MLLAGRVVDEKWFGWEGWVIVKATHGSIFTGTYELLRRGCLLVLTMCLKMAHLFSSIIEDGDKEKSIKS